MTTGSRTKGKPGRNRKPGIGMLVAEWTVEQAQTPDHVSVVLVVRSNSEEQSARCITRRLLLPRERAAELVEDIRQALEGCAAMASLGSKAATHDDADAYGEYAAFPGDAEDTDPLSNHFALGAYGLVGN